jgi:hypothetical protein
MFILQIYISKKWGLSLSAAPYVCFEFGSGCFPAEPETKYRYLISVSRTNYPQKVDKRKIKEANLSLRS